MTNPKAENDFLYWYLASKKIDEALKLDFDSIDKRCEDEDFLAALKLSGMTVNDLVRKYWGVRLLKLLSMFQEEIERRQNKSARQFVGEIITKADIPAPNWYVQALIQADRMPQPRDQGEAATNKVKLKLEAAFYWKFIEHHRKEVRGNTEDLVPEIFQALDKPVRSERTYAGYKSEVLALLGNDFFDEKANMLLLKALLRIDIEKTKEVLGIKSNDPYPQ